MSNKRISLSLYDRNIIINSLNKTIKDSELDKSQAANLGRNKLEDLISKIIGRVNTNG